MTPVHPPESAPLCETGKCTVTRVHPRGSPPSPTWNPTALSDIGKLEMLMPSRSHCKQQQVSIATDQITSP